ALGRQKYHHQALASKADPPVLHNLLVNRSPVAHTDLELEATSLRKRLWRKLCKARSGPNRSGRWLANSLLRLESSRPWAVCLEATGRTAGPVTRATRVLRAPRVDPVAKKEEEVGQGVRNHNDGIWIGLSLAVGISNRPRTFQCRWFDGYLRFEFAAYLTSVIPYQSSLIINSL